MALRNDTNIFYKSSYGRSRSELHRKISRHPEFAERKTTATAALINPQVEW